MARDPRSPKEDELWEDFGITSRADKDTVLVIIRTIYAPIQNNWMASGKTEGTWTRSSTVRQELENACKAQVLNMPAIVHSSYQTTIQGVRQVNTTLIVRCMLNMLYWLKLHDPTYKGVQTVPQNAPLPTPAPVPVPVQVVAPEATAAHKGTLVPAANPAHPNVFARLDGTVARARRAEARAAAAMAGTPVAAPGGQASVVPPTPTTQQQPPKPGDKRGRDDTDDKESTAPVQKKRAGSAEKIQIDAGKNKAKQARVPQLASPVLPRRRIIRLDPLGRPIPIDPLGIDPEGQGLLSESGSEGEAEVGGRREMKAPRDTAGELMGFFDEVKAYDDDGDAPVEQAKDYDGERY
jgi:hypothetical protein